MPPQKKDKKKQQRSYRGVASFDAVKARNAADSGEGVGADKNKEQEDESSSSEEEEEVNDPNVFKKEKGATLANIIDRQSLNTALNTDDQLAGGPSRKQREEIEKEKKRRAYEKLHREGKTDEAKADLARLAEIKARREAAIKEREDKKLEEEAKKGPPKASTSAYVEALGGEKSRKMPGGRKKNDDCADIYEAYRTEKKAEEVDPATTLAGSIEACRLEEDDFM
mmetsp:Transcript_22227/g.56076  ORF Transcript_22227/g.56076 Transcript_22227/m.56076 type:complete len:225 (+) Transcript_22227:387-1061(+)|eukprot:CAMPEP_0178996614 /NCGR_PEP_ID=MMETSP0795-20121207/8462_1 /TAXON_ID=88552 /ORGANISM="Amoebophrya sp., Strain Ameob2" /LENGTH=224 /DNA_ID=CAMNT_0020689015 /DNA_START=322 /DNA_END=996 /DNA_ORIENTATION=+